MCMSFAAGLNVAVTRTPFASPLILATLSGQPNVMAPALCAALASLFVTRSSKFIGPQSDRADLQFMGDLKPLEDPAMRYEPPLPRSSVAPAPPANGDTEGGAPDKQPLMDNEITTSGEYSRDLSFQNTVGLEGPAVDYSVRSEASFSGGKELAAAATAAAAAAAEEERAMLEEDPDSPITASYRQGELIKMMVSGRRARAAAKRFPQERVDGNILPARAS